MVKSETDLGKKRDVLQIH